MAAVDADESELHRASTRKLVELGHSISHSEPESGIAMTGWRLDECKENPVSEAKTCRRIRWRVISSDGELQVSAQCQIREGMGAWGECAKDGFPIGTTRRGEEIARAIRDSAAGGE